MEKKITKVERYLTPSNKLFVNGIAQEITKEEWDAIPAKDKILFEDVVKANPEPEAKNGKN